MVNFGQSDSDREVWIKGFKDGDTLIRFCQPVEDWVRYYEHYDRNVTLPGNKKSGAFFACVRAVEGKCAGCDDPDEKVSKASPKWVMHTLNPKNQLDVTKVGVTIKDNAQMREQRLGTISDRDVIITREGTGLNTKYMSDWQEKADRSIPTEKFHDLFELLLGTYRSWVKARAEEDEPEPDEPVDDAKVVEEAPAKHEDAPDELAAAPEPSKADVPPVDLWSTAELREYLTENGVDYGKAPRSKLVTLVKSHQG